MTQSSGALRLRDVSVRFGNQTGLANISLDIDAGEKVVVVGPSGAGKTTLLRAIAGLTPITSGELEIAGQLRTQAPPEQRGAVYLHQTPHLFPHLNVFENVAFPLRVQHGAKQRDIRERVMHALDAVDLAEFASRRTQSLSGGQRHRVALARATVGRPEVLLLDEPLSSLDPALRDEVRQAILDLQREYCPALVVVTHDLDDAALMADRVAVLLDGRIAQTDSPDQLFRNPSSPQIARLVGISNELQGEIGADNVFRSVLGETSLRTPLPAGRAIAMFRPDAIRAAPAAATPGTTGPGTVARVARLLYRPQRPTIIAAVAANLFEVAMEPGYTPIVEAEIELVMDWNGVSIFGVG